MVGDDVFIPVQNRTYDAGNYVYAEFAKTLKSHTRLTFGAFDFTAHVVASGIRQEANSGLSSLPGSA